MDVCLLFLLHPNGNVPAPCCPEECSAWSWHGADANEGRDGHCILAGRAEDFRPVERKAG